MRGHMERMWTYTFLFGDEDDVDDGPAFGDPIEMIVPCPSSNTADDVISATESRTEDEPAAITSTWCKPKGRRVARNLGQASVTAKPEEKSEKLESIITCEPESITCELESNITCERVNGKSEDGNDQTNMKNKKKKKKRHKKEEEKLLQDAMKQAKEEAQEQTAINTLVYPLLALICAIRLAIGCAQMSNALINAYRSRMKSRRVGGYKFDSKTWLHVFEINSVTPEHFWYVAKEIDKFLTELHAEKVHVEKADNPKMNSQPMVVMLLTLRLLRDPVLIILASKFEDPEVCFGKCFEVTQKDDEGITYEVLSTHTGMKFFHRLDQKFFREMSFLDAAANIAKDVRKLNLLLTSEQMRKIADGIKKAACGEKTISLCSTVDGHGMLRFLVMGSQKDMLYCVFQAQYYPLLHSDVRQHTWRVETIGYSAPFSSVNQEEVLMSREIMSESQCDMLFRMQAMKSRPESPTEVKTLLRNS